MDNRWVLTGKVVRLFEVRYSPAGIPISRFVVQHHSQQVEAGLAREAHCRVIVMAAGNELQPLVGELSIDSWVRVEGFVSRASYKTGDARLVLHAHHIQPNLN